MQGNVTFKSSAISNYDIDTFDNDGDNKDSNDDDTNDGVYSKYDDDTNSNLASTHDLLHACLLPTHIQEVIVT